MLDRELLIALTSTDRELSVPGLLDQSSVHELGHQARGGFGRVRLDLELFNFLLECIELGQFSLSLGLLNLGRLLIFAHLLDSAASFAIHLEHICRYALSHYGEG